MRLGPTALACLLLLAAAPALAASGGERKKVAERAGCAISVGDRDARGTELVIADCAWPVPPGKVVAAVTRAADHDVYLSSVKESTALPDGRVLQVHQASGIGDRQITLDFTTRRFDDGGVKVSWTRSATQEPLVSGRVDCPLDDGAWEVHPDGQGGSKVTYTLRYDPGGKVPLWLVRAFQKGGMADLVEEMRKAAAAR
ncbi:START domain-containing protein [Myxococcota bacterium]|nr:START domain-containing protein [Myxococcota bacterium]